MKNRVMPLSWEITDIMVQLDIRIIISYKNDQVFSFYVDVVDNDICKITLQ